MEVTPDRFRHTEPQKGYTPSSFGLHATRCTYSEEDVVYMAHIYKLNDGVISNVLCLVSDRPSFLIRNAEEAHFVVSMIERIGDIDSGKAKHENPGFIEWVQKGFEKSKR